LGIGVQRLTKGHFNQGNNLTPIARQAQWLKPLV
jgi:hypothetical protein